MGYRSDMRNPYGRQMGSGGENAENKKLFLAWQSGKKLTPTEQALLIKAGLAMKSDFNGG